MSELIALMIDSMDRAPFMRRIAKALASEAEALFVTTEPVPAAKLRLEGYRTLYLRRGGKAPDPTEEDRDLARRSIEVLNGEVAVEAAAADIARIRAVLALEFPRRSVTRCLVWNGQQILGRATKRLCRDADIPTRFVEIANLPDKMFSDPDGVNAESELCRTVSLLDVYEAVPPPLHRQWIGDYEKYKAAPLPQSRSKTSKRVLSVVNHVAKLLTGGLCRREMRRLTISRGKSSKMAQDHLVGEADLPAHFLFLPLQVTGDTQLRLHSDVDNYSAIAAAADLARGQGAELVVKIHPAEVDTAAISRILDLQRDKGFVLTGANTTNLIRKAAHVVTINSTVGLEAMLFERPLTVLGRAVYRDFDQDRARKFVHSYLVSGIDYFGEAEVPAPIAGRLVGLQG